MSDTKDAFSYLDDDICKRCRYCGGCGEWEDRKTMYEPWRRVVCPECHGKGFVIVAEKQR